MRLQEAADQKATQWKRASAASQEAKKGIGQEQATNIVKVSKTVNSTHLWVTDL